MQSYDPPISRFAFTVRFAALVAIGFAFFIACFFAARRISPDPIVFYQGLRCIGVATAVLGLAIFVAWRAFPRSRRRLDYRSVMPALVAQILLAYAFLITFPALLDRSISIYVIAVIAQSGERGLTKEEIQRGFLRDYVEGTAAVDKRLSEQLASSHVAERDGRFRITDRGRRVYEVNRALAQLFRLPSVYTVPRDPLSATEAADTLVAKSTGPSP